VLHLIADLLRVKGAQKEEPLAVVTAVQSDPNRRREILRRIAEISKARQS